MLVRLMTIFQNAYRNFTLRRFLAVTLGNVVLGFGVAALKLSMMGNDPFTAHTMALSEGFGIGLGNYQLMVNIALAVVQFLFGAEYIGLGTIVNMCFLGYIVQFAQIPLEAVFGTAAGHALPYQLVYMAFALAVVAFGLSMYQTANMGVSPFDYLSMGMTDRWKLPYFVNRVITDGTCVVIILLAVAVGFIGWDGCHLGIGTIACAFCLGPFVQLCNKIHGKWVR